MRFAKPVLTSQDRGTQEGSAMNGKTMDERVTDLEKLAESLAPLPARMKAVEGRLGVVDMRLGTVESQIVQLRTEMAR